MSYVIWLSGLLILCLTVGNSVCFEFDNSYGTKTIYANTSGEATIAFRYITGNEIRNKTRIVCGYIEQTNLQLIALVIKERRNNATSLNASGSLVAGRSSPYTDPEQSNVIGIKLKGIRKTDPVQYKCRANIQHLNGTADNEDSNLKILKVLDPPKFVNCLTRIESSVTGKPVSFTCSVTGNPTPYLQCHLLRFNGSVIQSTENKQENISSQFLSVTKYAHAIRCVAEDDKTGRAVITKPTKHWHTPYAPKKVRLASFDSTSINIRWKSLFLNESGESFHGYKIYWSKQGEKKTNFIKFRSWSRLREDYTSFRIYTIRNLIPNTKYMVWVIAFNFLGDGDMSVDPITGKRHVITTRRNNSYIVPSSDNGAIDSKQDNNINKSLGAVIGGATGGVFLLVLIVILFVRLRKRPTPSRTVSIKENTENYYCNASLYCEDVGCSRLYEEPSTKPSYEEPCTEMSLSKPSYEEASTKPSYEVSLSQPSNEEPSTKPSYEVSLSNPSNEEPSTKPFYEEPSTKPSYEVFHSKSSNEEPSTKPFYKEPSAKPSYEVFLSKPSNEEHSTKPSYEVSLSKPSNEEHSTKPSYEVSLSKPSDEEYSTKPSYEVSLSKPSNEEHSTKPSYEVSLSKPSNEEHSTKPSYEVSLSKPSNEEHSTKPSYKDSLSKHSYEVSLSKPFCREPSTEPSYDVLFLKRNYEVSLSKPTYEVPLTKPHNEVPYSKPDYEVSLSESLEDSKTICKYEEPF